MSKQEPKVVLITGAAQRIGAELARTFHTRGYRVVLHYGRSADAALQMVNTLNSQRPHSATSIQGDLTQLDDIESLATRARDHWGKIDVLINNASRFYPTDIGNIDSACWDDLINSNTRAPFFLSQALTPALKQSQGCIINIVDIYAERPLKGYPVYSISKAAIAMLTKTLARELGPEVRVNGISPGAILWPENAAELDEKTKQFILDNTALKCSGSPQDICHAALFLADAHYVTGQIIPVDGGRSLNQ